ncbi:hypothetical protein NP493_190g03002 [Ridgeia piscesae]|uniref:VWFA domain-containing protein n=1 Tax=Ridgeia piscesae TaxID=27915 RepID=A0AAD9P262_RIDPI|nr:hypothetical protein NP493_190g03002 [Ridgeia piscesae]
MTIPWGECSVTCGNGTRSREAMVDGELVVQEIQCSLQSCDLVIGNCTADIMFVLDSSGSIGYMKWFVAKQFVIDVVKGLKIREDQTRIGVISFSTTVRTDISLGEITDTDELINKVWDIDYMAGVTNTAGGLKLMHEVFLANKREHVTQIAVLLTDGNSNLQSTQTIPNANAAAADGFEIFAIGVGAIDIDELKGIATNDDFVYKVPDFSALSGVTNDVIEMTCYANECYLCDFTKGQIWLPDRHNCHMFYVCEPIGWGQYRKHHMTCGDLWWHQDIHSCERTPQEDCDKTGPVVDYIAPSTTKGPCPFEQVPGQGGYFRSIDSPTEIQHCVQGMVFLDPPCECVQVGEIIPSCSDDLLLYFPYEEHYNDVTCHHAIATQYGSDVSLQFDAVRNGHVACFGGESHFEVSFLRTWFAQNNVDKFSIAVYFKRNDNDLNRAAAFVSNRNCKQSAGFKLGSINSGVMAGITADNEVEVNPPVAIDNDWHHAAWVYDGKALKLYIDGAFEGSSAVEVEPCFVRVPLVPWVGVTEMIHSDPAAAPWVPLAREEQQR